MAELESIYRSPVSERMAGEIVSDGVPQHDKGEVISAAEMRVEDIAPQGETELAERLLVEKIRRIGSTSSHEREAKAGSSQMEASPSPFQTLHQALGTLAVTAKNHSSFTRRINPFRELFDGPRRSWQERTAKKNIVAALPSLEAKLVTGEDAGAVLDAFYRLFSLMEDDGINYSLHPNREIEKGLYIQAATIILAHGESVLAMSEKEGVDTEKLAVILANVVEKSPYLTKGMFGSPYDTKPFIKTVVPFLQSRLQKTEKNPEQYPDLHRACGVLARPFILSDDQAEAALGQDIFLQAFAKTSPEVGKEMLAPYIVGVGPSQIEKKRCAKLRGELVKRLGLDYGTFFDADKYHDPKKFHRSIEENFVVNVVAANELEKALPGSVKRLADDYGILTFARYPKELLLWQLEQEEDREHPYGVILYPREDWNGAFYKGRRLLEDLASPANQAAMNVRIFECTGKLDVTKKLIRLNRRYGEKQKIGFALVGGHANLKQMHFSSAHGLGQVREENLSPVILAELKTFFSVDATVVFQACSIGGDDGLGQFFSSIGISVVAPDQPASLKWIHAKREGEKIVVTAEYWAVEGRNPLRRYVGGKLVERSDGEK